MSEIDPTPKGRFIQGLTRGFARQCPNCGKGPLYRRYISVQATCTLCGHDNGQYRADDAGPYFTILVVGHLVIGPMLFSPFIWKAPIWLVLGTTLPIIAVLTLVLLPIIKGGVIGAQWAMNRKADFAAQASADAEIAARPPELESV